MWFKKINNVVAIDIKNDSWFTLKEMKTGKIQRAKYLSAKTQQCLMAVYSRIAPWLCGYWKNRHFVSINKKASVTNWGFTTAKSVVTIIFWIFRNKNITFHLIELRRVFKSIDEHISCDIFTKCYWCIFKKIWGEGIWHLQY